MIFSEARRLSARRMGVSLASYRADSSRMLIFPRLELVGDDVPTDALIDAFR